MRVPQSYIQKCKVVAHVFQGIFVFVGGCITLAVLTKGGDNGGATKWYFALCFLTVPGLIYLTMTPMWNRALKFANAYAFVAADALYTIFWFSAFIAIAFYNSSGIKQGAKDRKLDERDGNCTTFKWGSESKCKLSRASFGIAVVIWIFFLITLGISCYYFIKFRKEGIMPYQSATPNPHHITGDPTLKDNNAWSTEIEAQRDSNSFDDTRTERGGNQEEDEYALLNSTETDEGRHPGRPISWGHDRLSKDGVPPYAGYADNASALSPVGYDEYRREAAPVSGSGGYSGTGYSFSGGDR